MFFVGIAVIGVFNRLIVDPETTGATAQKQAPVTMSHALMRCQEAIKNMSKDPPSAEVPFVQDFGSGDEYYFAWGSSTAPVRMKNSFGTMLSVGASCIYSKSMNRVTSITLDGKTIY